jgi:hypothetical protein
VSDEREDVSPAAMDFRVTWRDLHVKIRSKIIDAKCRLRFTRGGDRAIVLLGETSCAICARVI